MKIQVQHLARDHFLDKYMAIAEALGANTVPPVLPARDPLEGLASRGATRRRLGNLVSLHPETAPPKTFTAEQWIEIVTAILRRGNISKLVILGEVFAQDLASHFSTEFVQPVSNFADAASWLGASDAFVGIDSCFLHYADLIGTPSLGIFRNTSPARWGFRLNEKTKTIVAPAFEDLDPTEVAEWCAIPWSARPN
jgi:ADP-heptose:LPS heptosyltransferase